MKNIIYIFFLLFVGISFSQDKNQLEKEKNEEEKDTLHFQIPNISSSDSLKFEPIFFDWNDSINMDRIRLDEIEIIAPFKFEDIKERNQYLILQRKTRKVWPYAVLAAERLEELRNRLDLIESNYDKKAYTQRVQRYMEGQFAKKLKKLTRSEGQILVKLLYRQTGETTYEILKDLRSGWRAFRYNITAGMFTISLKEEYNPLENKEDYFIEHILRRSFQMGYLDEENPNMEIDFSEALQKWEKN